MNRPDAEDHIPRRGKLGGAQDMWKGQLVAVVLLRRSTRFFSQVPTQVANERDSLCIRKSRRYMKLTA
jgi:hypothetical protein